MRYTYRFIESVCDHVPHECHICRCVAPLGDFKLNKSDGSMEQVFVEMCEVCAATFISNTIHWKSVYSGEQAHMALILAQVANLLLDKLTDRRRELNESN